MKEAVPAIVAGLVAGFLGYFFDILDRNLPPEEEGEGFFNLSDGDILSIILIILVIYLLGEVRNMVDHIDTRPKWRRWLPKW